MGSAALFEAAKSIRDWSLNEGRASTANGKSNGKAVDAYASLVFNDKMQQDRLPKPVFRQESLTDIVRQALFLHEVAHPEIRFSYTGPEEPIQMPCDRRQLGQAFTNILKNAGEAIHEKSGDDSVDDVGDEIAVVLEQLEDRIKVAISDSGIGLPAERERLTEPYMTTRTRGTGLGLAIVKNIIEEHHASMNFGDRPGGGTIVTVMFDPSALSVHQTEAEAEPADLYGELKRKRNV